MTQQQKPYILFITSNKGKLNEIKEMFSLFYPDIKIEQYNLDLTEIQSIDVESVAKYKLDEAINQIIYIENQKTNSIYIEDGKLTVSLMIEDSGLYISKCSEVLMDGKHEYGFPGALIKFYQAAIGLNSMTYLHKDSMARAETVIGFYNHLNDTKYTFKGLISGKISNEPKGENGFGWDSIFIPFKYDKTYAEMEDKLKNQCSMRYVAFRAMIDDIKF